MVSSLISVSEALIHTSELSDILWVFGHFAPKRPNDPRDEKYVTLAQNPHFYDGFPTLSTASMDSFKTKPTEDYRGTIYVLTNDERRVCDGECQERFCLDTITYGFTNGIFGCCGTLTRSRR